MKRNSHFAHSVIERDKVCQVCGCPANLQAHHKIPISIGGADTPENGEALCPGCHADKHPDVPRGLFLNGASGSMTEAKWNATSLAANIGCCTRTVTRAAKIMKIRRVGGYRWGFTDEEADSIRECIRSHSEKKSKKSREAPRIQYRKRTVSVGTKTVKINAVTWHRLKKVAYQCRISMQELASKAIEEHIARREAELKEKGDENEQWCRVLNLPSSG